MHQIPDPNQVFPNEYKTSCFIKNVVKAPNISIGDYTYYDDTADPAGFEKTMCCSITRSLATISSSGNSAPSPPAQSLSWGRPTTASAASRPTRFMCSAEHGRRTPRPIWTSSPEKATSWSETTSGSGGSNPARVIKRRFDEGLTGLLLQFRWWDLEPEALVEVLPLLCDPDLEKVERELRARLAESN